jgi:tetratricopeptide (TPR) repeat protein
MPATEYAKMRRSDHSMRPPAPASTLAFGSPNACNLCHKDRDPAWARDRVKEWFGEGRQSRLLAQAELISAARTQDWSRLPAMLASIGRPDRDEVFAASLIRLLEPCRDASKVRALLGALEDGSPLIRASAVNALSGNWRPDTFSALTKAARDEYRVVRIQAGAVLATMDPGRLDEPSRRAAEEYVASLTSRPDDYGQHMNLGVLYADRGQGQAALDEYATAVRLRPAWAAPLVNAALVYSELGDNAKAEESLRKAIGIEPGNAAAHFNLGLLLAETGRRADAEASLRHSFALNPKNAPAAFNLAVLLSETRSAEAIEWCRRAVEADPGQGRYAYTLAFYLSQGGETQAAIRELEAAATRHAPTAEERDLLHALRSR